MFNLQREKLFCFLKQVQEKGIQCQQHVKQPFFYTGSWMENIQALDELYDFLNSVTPAEAVLCAFNLLCPHDKPLPRDEPLETIDKFYGATWTEALKRPLHDKLERERETQEKLASVGEL